MPRLEQSFGHQQMPARPGMHAVRQQLLRQRGIERFSLVQQPPFELNLVWSLSHQDLL